MMEPMHSTFSRREIMSAGLPSLGAAAIEAQSDLAALEGMIEGKIVALCDLESARMESVNRDSLTRPRPTPITAS